MTTEQTEHEQLLLALEAQVARGTVAIGKRNALMVEMHAEGKSLQKLADILNSAREAQGAPPITRHGVLAAIRRHGES